MRQAPVNELVATLKAGKIISKDRVLRESECYVAELTQATAKLCCSDK